jgi:hypothetical protein
VPEISVEGELPVDEAVVLDDVGDAAVLRDAHRSGKPVVVRAGTPDAVLAALAHPEVSAVVVPEAKRELLELDLTKLTYG